MNGTKLVVPDECVVTVWRCGGGNLDEPELCMNPTEVDVTFFEENGTPVCEGCGCDMEYDHTYINVAALLQSLLK
jgi:hypothetical protein